jgi:uncharacterized protein
MKQFSKKNLFAICIGIAMFLTINATANERYKHQKVVYHINYNNPKTQNGALGNVQHHIDAVGKNNINVIVLLHGKGLSLLLEPDEAKHTKLQQGNATPEIEAKIATLKNQGVKFEVCANTLKGKKINYEEDLYDVVKDDIVPSGVAELSRLEQMGYTYIKP